MLYRNGTRRLAPFYDLVCTLAWPELSKNLAMKIGNGKLITEIQLGHFRKMANECNLGWPMVRERVVAMSRRVGEALSTADLGGSQSEMASRVTALTRANCQRMLH